METMHALKTESGERNDRLVHLNDAELKKLQQELLGILRDFVSVCDKYGITYTLGGGSVLGAVRHHGFIPWDDDIDTNVTREGFARLREVFDKELGDRYILCAPEIGNGHGVAHAQIKKKGTVFRSFNELYKPASQAGIAIDVFVGENMFRNRILRTLHGALCLGMGFALTCRKAVIDIRYIRRYYSPDSYVFRRYRKRAAVGRLLKWIPLDMLARMTVRCYALCRNDRSEYISFITGRKHFFGETFKRSELFESVRMPFEDLEVCVPKGYKHYMTRLYGSDYMQVPPKSEREHHPIMELRFEEQ